MSVTEYEDQPEEWMRAVENAREAAKGWQHDAGEGLLSEAEHTTHILAECFVCLRWDRWDNLDGRPGQHELVEEP